MKSVCFACGAEYTERHEKCRTCGSTHIAEVMRVEPVQQFNFSSNRAFGIKEIGELLRARAPWLCFRSSSTEPAQPRKPIDIEELDGFPYLMTRTWPWLRLLAAALLILSLICAVIYGILFFIGYLVMNSVRMGNH